MTRSFPRMGPGVPVAKVGKDPLNGVRCRIQAVAGAEDQELDSSQRAPQTPGGGIPNQRANCGNDVIGDLVVKPVFQSPKPVDSDESDGARCREGPTIPELPDGASIQELGEGVCARVAVAWPPCGGRKLAAAGAAVGSKGFSKKPCSPPKRGTPPSPPAPPFPLTTRMVRSSILLLSPDPSQEPPSVPIGEDEVQDQEGDLFLLENRLGLGYRWHDVNGPSGRQTHLQEETSSGLSSTARTTNRWESPGPSPTI